MPSLFLSYRRTDSPDTVKLIHERLKRRLPRWEVFYDHESIPLGEQFPERLRTELTSATAVLVLIGPRWLEILQQRKGAAVDHVRVEVRLALEATTNVVPILLGHAPMPAEADLADFEDLLPLLRRNGRPVRPDPDFDGDLERVVAHLRQLDSNEGVGATLADKYTLTAEVGHGGMGVVYLAEQKQPVKRTVAVKLIKPGMDSRDVLARFEAERQALAVMDHPNIARVYDAGMTASGRPFFVMEQVKGVPITQYCDEKRLAPHERLRLFIPVCNAVQHAHQKGIIHRDLKPSNVLVEVVDGQPVPKVIDFGLAKALGQKLTDQTLYTDLGIRIGTLEYSAPEQAAGRPFDVDTRSDIYSLGVLLYELLTGAPPFTHEELLKLGEDEMRRAIREDEPARPSKRLSSSGELPAIAAKRHLEPNKLTRLVQGDLDWIVMRCLEKERERRYKNANDVGEELQRFLADQPVQAGPPSATYRLRKFVRRNRAGLLTAAAVLLAVLSAAGGVGWALWDRAAREAARRVELAGRMAETEKAVTVALTRAQQSEERAKQLPCTTSAEARAALAEWREAAAALAEAEAALTTGAAPDDLRERVADLGRRIEAGRVRTQRRERLFRDLDGARMAMASIKESKLDYAGAAAKFAAAFARFGLDVRSGKAEDLARRIRAEERAVREALIVGLDTWWLCAEGPVRAKVRAAARAADQDAWRRAFRQAAFKEDRAALVRLAKEARRETLPLGSLEQLALALYHLGRREEALGLLRWARGRHPSDFWVPLYLGTFLGEATTKAPVELEERVGCFRVAVALQPDSSLARNSLGLALHDNNQPDEALAQYKKAIALDPDYAEPHHNLGRVLDVKNQLEGAIAEYKKALALDPKLAAAHLGLGHVLRRKNQLDEAIAEHKKALALDPKLPGAHSGLGVTLASKGRLDDAIAAHKQALRLNPKDATAHTGLGWALHDKGQLDAAIAAHKQAIALNPKDATAHTGLGWALHDKGQLDAAIAEHKKAVALDPKLAAAHLGLGASLQAKNQLDAAIAEYQKAIALDPKDVKGHLCVGSALIAKNRLDDAVAAFHKAIALDPNNGKVHYYLGAILLSKNRADEASAAFNKAVLLEPGNAKAHQMLGLALFLKGQFAEARTSLQRALDLLPEKGPQRPDYLKWRNNCDTMLAREAKLLKVLSGKTRVKDNRERLTLIEVCQLQRRHVAAARLYADAFTADTDLADDLDAGHRSKAASFAARAAAGQGKDADKLTDPERAELRQRALQWLRADLAAWGKQLDQDAGRAGPVVRRAMTHWKENTDLAGVRDPKALEKLPPDERDAWQKLWKDVDALLARSLKKK